jgi:hypothetical protein
MKTCIPVNEYGEFFMGCSCGGIDFYTVDKVDGVWQEIEPTEQWQGWGCINCNRVFDDDGVLIEHPKKVHFQY